MNCSRRNCTDINCKVTGCQHPAPEVRELHIPSDVRQALSSIEDEFRTRAKRARSRARHAWQSGHRGKHSKFCAVARVWELAAERLLELNLPF